MRNLGLILFAFPLYSQRYCSSGVNLSELQQTNPEAYQRIIDFENNMKASLTENSKSVPTVPIIIPVVVHVVYNNNDQNISDAQINSQIEVLNEDYNRRNLGWSDTYLSKKGCLKKILRQPFYSLLQWGSYNLKMNHHIANSDLVSENVWNLI